MANIMKNCPVCNGDLFISALQCKNCQLELKGNFENDLNFAFENDLKSEKAMHFLRNLKKLNIEQINFLIDFLEYHGKMSNIQEKMSINYSSAKRKFNELLDVLGLDNNDAKYKDDEKNNKVVPIDMKNWSVDTNSIKASEIIKSKLKEANGKATVPALTKDKVYDIIVIEDDRFYCEELFSSPKYNFGVFDVIVDLLKKSENGSARKGNGRIAKLGDPGCEENTIVGCIAKYMNKSKGESVDDPVFVIAAILDWANIAKNERGKITLTSEYIAKCFESELLENAEIAKKKYGYNATYYLQMIKECGGIKTAHNLIKKAMTGSVSEGFLKLVECGSVDLSMEASVCKTLYQDLFTEEEIQFCKDITKMHKKK